MRAFEFPQIGQLYSHYKGGQYRYLMTARDEASQKDIAVYQNVETRQVWTRPLEEFAAPRFTHVPPKINPYSIPSAKIARAIAHKALYGPPSAPPVPAVPANL